MEPLFYLTQQYWCHVCRKEFYIRKTESFEEEILCLNCKSDFCEEIVNSENNPKNFTPYQYKAPPAPKPNCENPNINERITVLENTLEYFSRRLLDRYIDQLILRLIARRREEQRSPASKKIVKELPCVKFCEKAVEKLENQLECSVCKEDFKENDLIKQMPCKHQFHCECLDPWLSDHNSCPICRFALPLEEDELENSA